MQKKYFLGVEGFPSGRARIEKIKLIGKSLIMQNSKVHFISNSWSIFKERELEPKGESDGLTYHYSYGLTYRPKSFLNRRIEKLWGNMNEILHLLSHRCDVAIISVTSGMFFPIFNYWIISSIKRFKIYYTHSEN